MDFLLTNHSFKRQQVAYAVRAHLIRSLGKGAKSRDTVGELHGEVELLGGEQRAMREILPVNELPTMIITTAWVRD